MASIRRDIDIAAEPAAVWAAIRDVGAVSERLARGFVVASRLEEADLRVVTFSNGYVARERIVDLDDEARRIAYSGIGGGAAHHHATMEVVDAGNGHTRLVWISDIYPHQAAGPLRTMVDLGVAAMKRTLEKTDA